MVMSAICELPDATRKSDWKLLDAVQVVPGLKVPYATDLAEPCANMDCPVPVDPSGRKLEYCVAPFQ